MRAPRLPVTVGVVEDGGFTLPPITNMGVVSSGVELRLTEWEGWDDTAEPRAGTVDVPGGDGVYDGDPTFSARTFVMRGVALAESPDALLTARGWFVRLLAAERRRGMVTVVEGGLPGTSARVRLGGKTSFKLTGPLRAEWSLSLFAPLPGRRSAESRSLSTGPFVPSGGLAFPWTFPLTFGAGGAAGQLSCTNDGLLPAAVELSIVGACSNPQVALVETGERVAYPGDVASSLVIDTRERSVTLDGAPGWGGSLTSDSVLFRLPAQTTSTLLFLVDSGNPTLTATWTDETP